MIRCEIILKTIKKTLFIQIKPYLHWVSLDKTILLYSIIQS